ncbi:hypothetical protein B296_00019915 [Ensete ventricosum]|uniref:Uncharacterized protein n=1 Tax=Ensete ventricosum TaxID=4639 RepID=A0A426ZK62_ENSVE|nr:hypothetical protein B296_00019915 [Ensete ventricosum]
MANIDSVGRVFLTHMRQAHLARVFVMANIVGVGRVFPTKTSHARSAQSLRCGRPRSLTLPWWISRFPIVADLEASLRILGFPPIANPSWQISGFPVLVNLEASLTVANFGLSRHNGSQSLTPRWRISSFPAVKMEAQSVKETLESECSISEYQKDAVIDFKAPVKFRNGLERTRLVSYQFGYQIVVARFKVRCPQLEIKNPFTDYLEDQDVPMEVKMPFNNGVDSPPHPTA